MLDDNWLHCSRKFSDEVYLLACIVRLFKSGFPYHSVSDSISCSFYYRFSFSEPVVRTGFFQFSRNQLVVCVYSTPPGFTFLQLVVSNLWTTPARSPSSCKRLIVSVPCPRNDRTMLAKNISTWNQLHSTWTCLYDRNKLDQLLTPSILSMFPRISEHSICQI